MSFLPAFPADHNAARTALYNGQLFLMAGSHTTRELVAEINTALEETLGTSPREAQFQMDGDSFYASIGQLRKRFYGERHFHHQLRQILADFGFHPNENAFDPMRLRVVTHLGYTNPKAAPVYYPHRDTWYANPQGQLTWWIPLHDVEPAETFEFFPEYFQQPVVNNSQIFDYNRWVQRDWTQKIGWQNAASDDVNAYPSLGQEIAPKQKWGVRCKAGDLLVFAGAHLHGTLGQETGRTRFSIDFRTVHMGDHQAGVGAPNVDNRSTGSTLRDHVLPHDPLAWGGYL